MLMVRARGEIVLVRHALPDIPRLGGPDDYQRPLTAAGMAQAEALVGELIALGPTLVASSPYLRAVQTVAPLAEALGLTVRTDHDLREWDSGLEPTPDYARHYAASWADPEFARPGGESLRRLTERAVAVLTFLAEPGGVVVVGSHGTFLSRALLGFGLAVDWPFSRDMPMPAVYRLRFVGRHVHVIGPGGDCSTILT
jgi:2,3-bisphosphoglycerate-dependent phosphoglycerate mutase